MENMAFYYVLDHIYIVEFEEKSKGIRIEIVDKPKIQLIKDKIKREYAEEDESVPKFKVYNIKDFMDIKGMELGEKLLENYYKKEKGW